MTESQAPRTGPSAVRWTRNVLVFLVSLFLSCLAVRAGLARIPDLRLEEPGGQRIKARHFELHKDEFDVLFVGSSRVLRHVNPAVFDLAMAEAGRETRSYNFGLPGMRLYESLYMVDWLLDQDPENLEWLVFELQEPDPDFKDQSQFTRRSIAWHTPRIALLLSRTILASDRPTGQKLLEVATHLLQSGYNLGNAATGIPAAEALLGLVEVPPDVTRTGFVPLDIDPNASTKRRGRDFQRELRDEPNVLSRWLRELLDEPDPGPLVPGLAAELEDLADRIRARGIRPVFLLLSPAQRNNADMRRALEEGVLPNLISLDDPERYREFYVEEEIRFDRNHVKRKGANRMTRLLVGELLTLFEEAGG